MMHGLRWLFGGWATLKNNVVSGPAAGWLYYCRMGTWFFHFANFFFFWGGCQNFIIFLPKKKILRPPDWPQFRPPAGQETIFLRVALVILVSKSSLRKSWFHTKGRVLLRDRFGWTNISWLFLPQKLTELQKKLHLCMPNFKGQVNDELFYVFWYILCLFLLSFNDIVCKGCVWVVGWNCIVSCIFWSTTISHV